MKLVELAFFTDDVQAMADFYRRLLGAEPIAASPGMAIFMVGHTKIFIHHTYKPREGELPPEDHIALEADDVDAACQMLVRRGLTLEVPPEDYDWGRSAYLRDSDGHLVEIVQAQNDKNLSEK